MKDKDVLDSTIFKCIAGSKSYGTSTPTSDEDIRGICIPKNKSYYIGFGLNNFDQKDSWGTGEDTVIYDLRKFMSLAANNNPNILDLLFSPEDMIIQETDEWQMLKEHRNAFLSKKVRFTYSGYAMSQLKKIQRHRGYLLNPPTKRPERVDFNLPEHQRLATPEMIGAFQWVVADMLKNNAQKFNFSEEVIEQIERMNMIGLVQAELRQEHYQVIQDLTGATDAWMYAMQQEKGYSNAMNDWNAYQNWKKTRNDKRSALEAKYGYDTKHAMHLVRLSRMGKEILEMGQVIVKRPDAEELLAIRNGAWSYEQVIECAQQMEKDIELAYNTSSLPRAPDRVALDELCQEIIEGYVFK